MSGERRPALTLTVRRGWERLRLAKIGEGARGQRRCKEEGVRKMKGTTHVQ